LPLQLLLKVPPLEKENSPPPSAFAAFKERFENNSKEHQVTQAAQNPSDIVISNREHEVTPSSHEKRPSEEKLPIIINNIPDTIIAQAAPSASINEPSQSAMKGEQSPTQKTQPSQQNQRTSEQETSTLSSKLPLPPANIRK